MKRFYYVLLLLLCLSSCGKDDSISNNNSGNNSSNGNSSQTPTSEYYIKYTASRRGYPISNASVKITDEKGQTIDIVTDKYHFQSASRTIGPVKKGFTATMKVSPSMNLKIESSKDNAAFVEKASANSASNISYTIDY